MSLAHYLSLFFAKELVLQHWNGTECECVDDLTFA